MIEPKRRRLTEILPLEGIVEEESFDVNNQNVTTKKPWLHSVSHKDFAAAFAARVRREYHSDEVKIDSKLSQETRTIDEEGW